MEPVRYQNGMLHILKIGSMIREAEKLRIRIEILQSVAILFAGRSRARQVRHNIDYMVFNNPT